MRTLLDPVNPDDLRSLFRDVFRRLQRGKALERFVYFDGHYLLSLDGTGYFSSSKIHCASCLEKHHRGGGVTYHHQLLGATLVHPDLKEVIPLAPEPIINEDGHTKNDCERNATRRWLKSFRRDHPHLPVIILEDALSSNAPHLDDLREANAHYIIGVKPGDHAFLFRFLAAADEAGRTETLTLIDQATGVLHHFRFHNGVPLNESHQDCLVNVLEYWEVHPAKIVKKVRREGQVQYFSWITDFVLTPDNVDTIMRGGRAGALEDRERDLQHAEESGLQSGTQLRPRRAESVRGPHAHHDARLPRGPDAATVLSGVPGRLEEAGVEAASLGDDAQPF